MSPRKFDRFMVDVHIGTNRKLRRLTPAERWCHVAGVLALAAQAPIRGRLLVGHEDATPEDFAELAGVSVAVARSTLTKLRAADVVVPDEENHCERVHDWEDVNPAPKEDPTAAERMRRYRERRRVRGLDPRMVILERDGNACVVCGSTDRLAVDHVVPISKGGSDDPENLQTLCKACNSSKKDRDNEEWLVERLAALQAHRNARPVTDRNARPVTPGREEKLKERANALSSSPHAGDDPKATDEDRRLCRLLAEKAKARNEKLKVKSPERWLTDMRRLREIDGNSPAEIEQLIVWLYSDPGTDANFWASTIQSASGLREHFPQMWAKMRSAPLRAVPSVQSSDEFLDGLNAA